MVWRPSAVCLSCWHTHRDSPGAACHAASVHLGPTIKSTDILVGLNDYYLYITFKTVIAF